MFDFHKCKLEVLMLAFGLESNIVYRTTKANQRIHCRTTGFDFYITRLARCIAWLQSDFYVGDLEREV